MSVCEKCLKQMSPVEKAKAEIAEEEYREHVDFVKKKLLEKKSWRDILPFTVSIRWKNDR